MIEQLLAAPLLNLRASDWRAWSGVFGLALFAHPYFAGAFRRPFECDFEDHDYDPLGSSDDLGGGFRRFKHDRHWGIERVVDGVRREVSAAQWERVLKSGDDNSLVWVRRNADCGLFDMTRGELASPVELEAVAPFVAGRAVVQRGQKMGVLANDGRWVIAPDWDQIWPFSNGAAAVMRNDRLGFVDEAGHTIGNVEFDQADDFIDAGVARVRRGNRYGLLRVDGSFAQPLEHASLEWSDALRGWHATRDSDRSLLRADGRHWIEPGYDEIEAFVPDRFIRVERAGKQGLLTWAGANQLACEYDELMLLTAEHEVRIVARHSGAMGVIDASGRILVPFEFAAIESFEPHEEHGFTLTMPDLLRVSRVTNDARPVLGIWSIERRKLVVPCAYDFIWLTSFGPDIGHGFIVGVKTPQSEVAVQGRFRIGVLGGDGRIVVPVKYAWIGARTSPTRHGALNHVRGELFHAWSRGRAVDGASAPNGVVESIRPILLL